MELEPTPMTIAQLLKETDNSRVKESFEAVENAAHSLLATKPGSNNSRSSPMLNVGRNAAGVLQLSAVLAAAGPCSRNENLRGGQSLAPLTCTAVGHDVSKWDMMQADIEETVEEPAGLFGRLLRSAPFS